MRDVDVEVAEGTLTAILGSSGSGKTTLLRVIVGFIAPDAGTVTIAGSIVAGGGRKPVAPDKRAVGYVAQEGALYPHLSVGENIGFGLPRGERKRGGRVVEMLELVGLGSDYAERRPHELSGGEQRRVALARALAPRPRLVLLDEPFSGLDAALRGETRAAVLHALAQEGATAVMVTHDQAEALSTGHEVAVLRDGELVQTASPEVLYRMPADLDVARFVGEAVVIAGNARGELVSCALGRLDVLDPRINRTCQGHDPSRADRRDPARAGRSRIAGCCACTSRRAHVVRPGHGARAGARGVRGRDSVGEDVRARPARARRARPVVGARAGRHLPGTDAPCRRERQRPRLGGHPRGGGARRQRERPRAPAMTGRMRAATVAAVVLACSAVAVGCGGSGGDPQSIVLYSGQHPQLTDALVRGFEKQTGIDVKVRANDGVVLADQLLQEGPASPADVYFTENSPELETLTEHGLLAKLPTSTLQHAPRQDAPPSGTWAPVALRVSGLAYSPKLIARSSLPQSVLDLAQPQWKGKVAIAPTDSDFPPVVGAVLAQYGEAAAKQWLAGLKRNAQVFQTDEAVVAAVNSGRVATGVINHYYWYRLRTEIGAGAMHSAVYFFPDRNVGSIENISGVAVLRTSKHPELADRFASFLVSQAGQRIIGQGDDFEYPARPGVAANPQLPPLSSLAPATLGVVKLGNDQAAAKLIQQSGLA